MLVATISKLFEYNSQQGKPQNLPKQTCKTGTAVKMTTSSLHSIS